MEPLRHQDDIVGVRWKERLIIGLFTGGLIGFLGVLEAGDDLRVAFAVGLCLGLLLASIGALCGRRVLRILLEILSYRG